MVISIHIVVSWLINGNIFSMSYCHHFASVVHQLHISIFSRCFEEIEAKLWWNEFITRSRASGVTLVPIDNQTWLPGPYKSMVG